MTKQRTSSTARCGPDGKVQSGRLTDPPEVKYPVYLQVYDTKRGHSRFVMRCQFCGQNGVAPDEIACRICLDLTAISRRLAPVPDTKAKFILTIDGGMSWAGRGPLVTQHDTREEAEASLAEYVTEAWGLHMSDTDLPESNDAAVALYFEDSHEKFTILELTS